MKLLEAFKNPSKFIRGITSSKESRILENVVEEQHPEDIVDTGKKILKKGSYITQEVKDITEEVGGGVFSFLRTPLGKMSILVISLGSLVGLITYLFVLFRGVPETISEQPAVVVPDILKEEFENKDFLTASFYNGFFHIYSKELNEISRYGGTGIEQNQLNQSIEAQPENFDLVLALGKDNYLYYGTSPERSRDELGIYYSQRILTNPNYEKERTDPVYRFEDRYITLSTKITPSDIQELQRTNDGFVTFRVGRTFYVYNNRGDLVLDLETNPDDGVLYTYYGGEVYYIKNTSSLSTRTIDYSVVKVSEDGLSSRTRSYQVSVGDKEPVNMYVLNDDRILVAFEDVNSTSFYFVRLVDSDARTIFGFAPLEKDEKITNLETISYDENRENVLMLGGGIGKVFNRSGTQLWIR